MLGAYGKKRTPKVNNKRAFATTYSPKKFDGRIPPPPIKNLEYVDRPTKNDEICFSSIKQINDLLKYKSTTIEEIATQINKRQTSLTSYNFVVSDTAELTSTEAQLLGAKYSKTPFTFFTYGLKDISSMARDDVAVTEGSLVKVLYGQRVGFSNLARILKEKDGLFIGTTSLPEFGHKRDTFNLIIGQTRNPHNPNLTAGGSSGGSAGAVASGLAHVAFGTDSSGSIVIPAAFNGVVGFKPQKQRFQPFPHIPQITLGFCSGTLFKGWFTRSVEDSAVVYDLLNGNGSESATKDLNQTPSVEKIAYLPRFDYTDVDLLISASVGNVVGGLKSLLRVDIPEITSLNFADPSRFADIHWLSIYQAKYKELSETFSQYPWEEALDKSTKKLFADSNKITPAEVTASVHVRSDVASKVLKFFDEWEFLITPATPVLPWKAGHLRPPSYEKKARSAHTPFTYVFNYAKCPSIVIPCGEAIPPGESYAVPIGLQLVSSPKVPTPRLLQVARAIEKIASFSKIPRWEGLSYQSPVQKPNNVIVGNVVNNLATTVADFKKLAFGPKIDDCRAIYKKQLLDNRNTLKSYGITLDALIELVAIQRADCLEY